MVFKKVFIGLLIATSLGFSVTNAQQSSGKSYLVKIGERDSVYSELLKEQRDFYVQLPEYYIDGEKYPVAFVIDGDFLLPTVTNVQSHYSGGFTPDMILIGISNLNNRARDLTTSKLTEMYGMPYTRENGEAVHFLSFIEKELIPYVEAKYPVNGYRTLIGHSYGGLFTIYTLLNKPHLFNSYVAIDPSLDWDEQKLVKEAELHLKENDYSNKFLFMSLNGQLHEANPDITIDNVTSDTTEQTYFARSNLALLDLIRKNENNGLNFGWKFYPRDLHGTIQYPTLMDGLIHNFEWYQMENTYAINDPQTSIETLQETIEYRAKKLERHFGFFVAPYPEELLNVLGYMQMDFGQFEKAKMFFQFAVKFYPNSANAYDSLSEYYEKMEDYSLALECAEKAYKLNPNKGLEKKIKSLTRKAR
ncbi:MAG: prolyl oligopeptidase family serine peptidase [Bacteroidia bacterium]